MEEIDTHCIWDIRTQTVGRKAIWNGRGERTDGSCVLLSSFNLNIIYHNLTLRLISFWLPTQKRAFYSPPILYSLIVQKVFFSLFLKNVLETQSHLIPSKPISSQPNPSHLIPSHLTPSSSHDPLPSPVTASLSKTFHRSYNFISSVPHCRF